MSDTTERARLSTWQLIVGSKLLELRNTIDELIETLSQLDKVDAIVALAQVLETLSVARGLLFGLRHLTDWQQKAKRKAANKEQVETEHSNVFH